MNLGYNEPYQTVLNDDIINYIYNNVNDIDTIINICTTNKSARNMCSNRSFWERIMITNNLPLPQVEYNTAKEWIYYIQKEIKMKEKINNIINKIKNGSVKFYSGIQNNYFISGIFNKHDKIVMDYIDNNKPAEKITLKFSSSSKDNNRYYVYVTYRDYYFTYKINTEQLKTILYDLLSKNIIHDIMHKI